MGFIMKLFFLVLLIFFTTSVKADYWAKIDYQYLSQGQITVINNAEVNLRCKIRIYNQTAFMELGIGSKKPLKFHKGVKYHEISLACKKIDKVTRVKPWVLNPYVNGRRAIPSIFL